MRELITITGILSNNKKHVNVGKTESFVHCARASSKMFRIIEKEQFQNETKKKEWKLHVVLLFLFPRSAREEKGA